MRVSMLKSKSLLCTDLLARRSEVVDKLHEFEEAMDPILGMLGDPEVSQLIESGKYVGHLSSSDCSPCFCDILTGRIKFLNTWYRITKWVPILPFRISYKEQMRPKFEHRQTLETNPAIQALETNPDKQSYLKPNPWPLTYMALSVLYRRSYWPIK